MRKANMLTDQKRLSRKWQHLFLLIIVCCFTWLSVEMVQFDFYQSLLAIPTAGLWMVENLWITADTWREFPDIMLKLVETILMSVAATTIAAFISFFLGISGSTTTRRNGLMAGLSRGIASVARNIPVVAWALILLLSFGQNSLTGFLALFVGTVGFLTRAFMETIDEVGLKSFEALTATGATYFQVISKAVIPQALPQMLSWMLFMIETNIRSATLVGILTGTGIGYTFDLYYKTLNYEAVALVTLLIILTVIAIELTSNRIRKVIL